MAGLCKAGPGKMAALLAVLLVFFSLSAIADTAVVRIWNYNIHDKKYQQKMYKLFNQRRPDIRIEYTSQVIGVYPQVLEAAATAKDLPDLFIFGSGSKLNLDYLRAHNMIMPLNACAPNEAELKDWMSKFPPILRKFVEGVTVFDGKAYIVDLSGEKLSGVSYILPLFYNKTLLIQAGIQKPPATYSALRQTAAKLTAAGAGAYFGITSGHGSKEQWVYDVVDSIARFGGYYESYGKSLKDGKYHWSSPEFINGFDVWVNMRKDGSVFPGDMLMQDEQAKMTFATNKAALQFGGSWNVANYIAYNPEADFDCVLPPTPDAGQNGYYSGSDDRGGANGYVVSATTRNPGAVWEVIKFISSLEYQEGWVQGSYGVSYLPEANKRENFTLPQLYRFVQWYNDPSLFRKIPVVSEEASKVYSYQPGVYPTINDVMDNVYQGFAGYDAFKDLDKRLDASWDEALAKAQAAGVKAVREDFIFPDWDPPLKDYAQKKK